MSIEFTPPHSPQRGTNPRQGNNPRQGGGIQYVLKVWLPRLVVWSATAWLLLQLTVSAGMLLAHNWAAIRFPYPLDYGEGPLLDQSVRLARLENIYRRDISQMPYAIANYPPLFASLQVPFVWAVGPALWYGRTLSTLSILLAAASCGLLVDTLTKDRVAAVVGGLMLLAFPYVLHWSPFNRVDSLALGLSCAGLYVVVRWADRPHGRIGGAILLTLAVYTRQSYALAAPLAAFCWLLHERPRKRAWILTAWVAGLGAALLAVLLVVTRGGFWFHIVTANVNPFFWATVKRYAEEMASHVPGLLAGSATLLVAGAWLRPRAWWLIGPYLVGSVISAITVGKDGSSVNYMFELSAALSLTAGALVAWAGKRRWLRAFVILALGVQAGAMAGWAEENYVDRVMHKIEQEDSIARLSQIVFQADGPVLADEYMGLIPLAGQDLLYQPFEFKQLYVGGVWSQWPLVDQIYRQEFAAILLYDPPYWDSPAARWTDEMRTTMAMHYVESERLADVSVLVPRR